MGHSHRFTVLLAWMAESKAGSVLNQPGNEPDNPVIKYRASIRLGACISEESLDVLILRSQRES